MIKKILGFTVQINLVAGLLVIVVIEIIKHFN